MDYEAAWRRAFRGVVAVVLLLAGALLVITIVNASRVLDTVDRIGEAAESAKLAADSIRDNADWVGRDVGRITDAAEGAAQDFEKLTEDVEIGAHTLQDWLAR